MQNHPVYITSRLNIDNLEQAVDSWAEEHSDYNHFTGECVEGRMCGHYTQVVWEDTTRVGCAITECEDVQGISWGGSLIVCQYYIAVCIFFQANFFFKKPASGSK